MHRSNTSLTLHNHQRQQEMKKKSNMLPNHSPAVIKYDITCTVINILNLFTTVQDLQIGLMSD